MAPAENLVSRACDAGSKLASPEVLGVAFALARGALNAFRGAAGGVAPKQ